MHDAVLTQTARKLFPILAKFKEFYLVLGQLSSFHDVPTQSIDFLQKKVPRKIIESYIAKEVKDYF